MPADWRSGGAHVPVSIKACGVGNERRSSLERYDRSKRREPPSPAACDCVARLVQSRQTLHVIEWVLESVDWGLQVPEVEPTAGHIQMGCRGRSALASSCPEGVPAFRGQPSFVVFNLLVPRTKSCVSACLEGESVRSIDRPLIPTNPQPLPSNQVRASWFSSRRTRPASLRDRTRPTPPYRLLPTHHHHDTLQ